MIHRVHESIVAIYLWHPEANRHQCIDDLIFQWLDPPEVDVHSKSKIFQLVYVPLVIAPLDQASVE